jgi:putative endonuclease
MVTSPEAVVTNVGQGRHFERSEKPAGLRDCHPMFVYILASKTRRLYVGVTNDLVRRLWEHRTGIIPGFTKRYGIKRLVYFEQVESPEGAIRREKQIKSYARVKKLALIGSMNRDWNDLAEDLCADVCPAAPSLRSG